MAADLNGVTYSPSKPVASPVDGTATTSGGTIKTTTSPIKSDAVSFGLSFSQTMALFVMSLSLTAGPWMVL